MSPHSASSFLRRALVVDGVLSAATGLLMVFGADALQGALNLPAGLLRGAGLSLMPFAALVIGLARRESLPRGGVWAVIAVNAAWVVASVLLPFAGVVAPSGLGWAFLLAQAAAVVVFSEMEYVGLRRSSAA
jgi:hypothetical protein